MDFYIKLCSIDVSKLTSCTSSVEPLEPCQLSKGLVRELSLYMTRSHDFNFIDLMYWLSQLVPPLYKSNFDPSNQNVIRKRIEKINKNLPSKKDKKTPYLNEQFDFIISSVQLSSPVQLSSSPQIHSADTPRKVKLKKRNIELKEENKTCKIKVRCIENELLDATELNEQLRGAIYEKKNEVLDMKEHLDEISTQNVELQTKIEDENQSKTVVQKRLAATKRHLNAAKNKSSETVTTKHHSKRTCTEISGVSADIFVCESSTSSENVVIGKKIPGSISGEQQFTSGKDNYIAQIPIRTVDCVNATKREVQSRAREGIELLNFVAASEELQDENNMKTLLVEMMKQQPDLFAQCAEEAGISNTKILSPKAAVDLQSLLRITDYKMRDLRTILSNCNANILPSARKMSTIRKEKASHVDETKLECGEMYLRKSQRDTKIASCPFVRTKNLVEFIESTLKISDLNVYPEFNDTIWLLFSGDKGGDSMKFVFSIINDIKNGSVDNNHIYCMYAASDSLENMWKVFHPFISQLKDIQSDNFLLRGKKVKVFLGGDYHFIDDMLGHGGSSSSYPSSADFVSLQHLQNHAPVKHSLENCNILLRTVDWYTYYYNENRCDPRSSNTMRENAKNHFSVIEKMLFPIIDLNHVVPAVLHITLGITLRLFNMVEDECRKLDCICTTVDEINRKEELNQDWKRYSIEMEEKIEEEKRLSGQIIELENNISRFQAVMNNNDEENIAIAKVVNNSSKSKRHAFEGNCSSVCCVLTVYDENPLWVTCDTCDMDFHTFCEGFSAAEEIGVMEAETYHCLKCINVVSTSKDIVDLISAKAVKLLDDESRSKIECVQLSTVLDKLKSDVSHYMGPREKLLIDYLNEISVVRQAYHGHLLVGNHCVKVLKNYKKICEYMKDSPIKDKLVHMFQIYSSLQPLLYANRFLTADEVDKICSLCDEFGTYYPKYFPNLNIFRKVHELVITVPRFVKEHRTIGLLSEQSAESLHAAVNRELRSFAAIKSKTEQLRLQFVRQELRSNSNKKLLNRESRLCKNEHDNHKRVFLRTAPDSKRHCPVCEPNYF